MHVFEHLLLLFLLLFITTDTLLFITTNTLVDRYIEHYIKTISSHYITLKLLVAMSAILLTTPL